MEVSNIDTIIFDCDGVLVDSEPMSCYALNLVFQKYYSIEIGSDYSEVIGKSINYAIDYYATKHGLKIDNMDLMAQEKERAYYELATGNLQSFPNAKEFIKLLKKKSIDIAIASSGSLNKIMFSLDQVGFTEYFGEKIFSAEQVSRGKPAPDLLFYGLNQLGKKPETCLVIEDSIPGIKSALAAGIEVIGFPSTHKIDVLKKLNVHVANYGYNSLIKLFSSQD